MLITQHSKSIFPSMRKGKLPNLDKDAINYTYENAENIVNMLEVIEESANMMEDKYSSGYDSNFISPILGEKNIFVLRGAHSIESSQGPLVIR